MSLVSRWLAPVRELWRHRDLRLLLAAGVVSQTGDWMLATAIGFQVYALTGSTLASAAALFATQLPQVLVSSPAGVLVDRLDARRVLVVTNLAMAVVLLPLILVRDASQIWLVIVVVALSSCLSPFVLTAQMSLLPSLVHDETLMVTANAANAQVQNIARLVGAAAGGVIVSTIGLGWLAVIDAVSFVVAALVITLIRHRCPRGVTTTRRRPLRRDWIDGLQAIRGRRVLIVVLIFFGVSGIGEAFMGTLFAPFVADVLGAPPTTFGAIMSAQAVGGIVGGALVTVVGHRFGPRTLVAWGAVAFGAGDLLLFCYPLLWPSPWPAMIIIALVGVPGAALFAGVLTLFQSGTDSARRGRVYGVLTTVQNLSMLTATFVAGALAGGVGIVPVISVQAAAYLAVGVLVLVALRGRHGRVAVDPGRPVVTGAVEQLDNPATSTMLPNMALGSNVRTHTVTDPVAMRALAHPLRVRLQALVAREGSVTAADAARELEISHALASHHLRQLAKYGFIEPAEAADNKERPWRVTATNLSLSRSEPETRVAAQVLDRQAAERATQQLADWQDHRAADQPEWADLTGVQPSVLYLTPAELTTVQRQWNDLVGALAAERPIGHPERRPADARPIAITVVTVPLEPTASGG